MKKDRSKKGKSGAKVADKKQRATTDNLCKVIAEKYPEQLIEWLYGEKPNNLDILKTEINREPVRADSAILLSSEKELFHGEFQTTMKSQFPVPLRMLDYYVGYKRLNLDKRIRQMLIVLKQSDEEIPHHYEDERTYHAFDVRRMWEVDPKELLKFSGLLPLATICRTPSGEKLLTRIAAKIEAITDRAEQREILNMSRVFAGLNYDKSLVYRIFKETDMMEESSVYQDILQKGRQQGLKQGLERGREQGLEQGERNLLMRQLTRRFGKLPVKVKKQLESLSAPQLEELGEAMLDFMDKAELAVWLKQHSQYKVKTSKAV